MKKKNVLFEVTSIDGIALPNGAKITIVKSKSDTRAPWSVNKDGRLRRLRLTYTPEEFAFRLSTVVSPSCYGWGYDERANGIPFIFFGHDNEGRPSATIGGIDFEMLRAKYSDGSKPKKVAVK